MTAQPDVTPPVTETLNCSRCMCPLDAGARFCSMCGAAVGIPHRTESFRKNVAILFGDLVGSTTLAERMDPEALSYLMDMYFGSVSKVIAEHGGTVEKFIGDAVMAVFGVPVSHEDDIIRAVHAGDGIRSALRTLNEEFAREFDIRIQMRTGINYGEVAVGTGTDGEIYVTGDAVNVAARLEQTAPPDAILVSGPVARLARSCAELEPLPPMLLKGKTEDIEVWRLGEVIAPDDRADLGGPFIGRSEELAALHDEQRLVAITRATRVVRVLGPVGIGKSRLVSEFVKRLPDSEVLVGRCLAYGSGAALAPVHEVLSQLGGDAWEAEIGSLLSLAPDRELIVRRLAFAAGRVKSAVTSQAEIVWALRRLLEEVSRRRPLVVVWDDLHRAQPALEQVLTMVASQLTDAPVLLIHVARFEQDDDVADEGSRTILLEPLAADEAMELALALRPGFSSQDAGMPAVLAQVVRLSEGNPLYLQQLAAELDECPVRQSGPLIPLSLQAVLEAQLDRLSRSDRSLLARASVMGRDFWRDCLRSLAADWEDATLNAALDRLVRSRVLDRDEVRRSSWTTYRFCQPLMHEMTYRTASKRLRSRWHETVADWFDRQFAAEDDYAALAAHHLTTAVRLRREINTSQQRLAEIASRAADRAWAAARIARNQGDTWTAARLLEELADLLPADDRRRIELAVTLARCRFELSGYAAAREVIEQTTQALPDDDEWAMFARVEQGVLDVLSERGSLEPETRTAEEALGYFSAEPVNHLGLCRTHRLRAFLRAREAQLGAAVEELQIAGEHAAALGDPYEEVRLLALCCEFEVWGSIPVSQAITYCRSLLARHDNDRQLMLPVVATLGLLYGLAGRFDASEKLVKTARSLARDFHMDRAHAVLAMHVGLLDLYRGSPAAAEACFAEGAAMLRSSADDLPADGLTLLTVRAKIEQDDWAGARSVLDGLEESPVALSSASTLVARQLRGRIEAETGDARHAEALAREAVALTRKSDDLLGQADALYDLAEVLTACGNLTGALEAIADAAARYASKGATFLEQRALARAAVYRGRT
jgi:class 3 adenylate cyclase/tetratricopeptide (TPR) repeat protein